MRFFESMADNWRGWEGEQGWGSVDADFDISATADSLGHITLTVALRGFAGWWSAAGQVKLDAGQLPEAARKVKAFIERL